jgi:hypothetical protein
LLTGLGYIFFFFAAAAARDGWFKHEKCPLVTPNPRSTQVECCFVGPGWPWHQASAPSTRPAAGRGSCQERQECSTAVSFPLLFLPLLLRTGYSLSRETQVRSLYGKTTGHLAVPFLNGDGRSAWWGCGAGMWGGGRILSADCVLHSINSLDLTSALGDSVLQITKWRLRRTEPTPSWHKLVRCLRS